MESVSLQDKESTPNQTTKLQMTPKPSRMKRRLKRDKNNGDYFSIPKSRNITIPTITTTTAATAKQQRRKHKPSNLTKKYKKDGTDGSSIIVTLLPSLFGVGVLVMIVLGRMGFRGRASVAGIDLGTTNSVICIQSQAKSVGEIECIPDPFNDSPIVPSVVSFLDQPRNTSTKGKSSPESSSPAVDIIVGQEAKLRIDTHPQSTLYHAKRVIGRQSSDEAVGELREEVEYEIGLGTENGVVFRVPVSSSSSEPSSSSSGVWGLGVAEASTRTKQTKTMSNIFSVTPEQVGSYVVNHLMTMAHKHLGHNNVKSAVIAVPAKFNQIQRTATIDAFAKAGVTVTRVLEEPTAAALAYGLNRKDGVHHILVYDFGGGTLDVSVLHVSEDGYVDVMGSDGDDRLGGADFDAAVAHYLQTKGDGHRLIRDVGNALNSIRRGLNEDEHDLEAVLASHCPNLMESASLPLCTLSSFHTIGEKMKIALSSYPNGGGIVQQKCLGLPMKQHHSLTNFCSSLVPHTLTLTSEEYDNAVSSLYDRSMLPIRRVLSDLNLDSDEIDEVVMVGGTTRMPKIRTLVQKELGVSSLNTHIDPDLTVAHGAASVID